MPRQATVYRIMVASPADCVQERKLIPDLIYAWNAAHSFHLDAVLEPVLWETHARPELGDRPQAMVNKQLVENCDILVGTFWTRLGTSTGTAESGTAEEITEFRSKKKPVLLYFSLAPVVLKGIDLTQYQALIEYKERLGKNGLYFDYESLNHLRGLFQGHLAGTMAELHTRPDNATPPTPEARQADQLREYIGQFESFLRRFEAEWVSERDSDPDGIDEGKKVLASGLEHVLSFRSHLVNGFDDVKQVLYDASKALRALQRHQLRADGGRSMRQFWSSGNAVLDKLKTVPVAVSAKTNSDTGRYGPTLFGGSSRESRQHEEESHRESRKAELLAKIVDWERRFVVLTEPSACKQLYYSEGIRALASAAEKLRVDVSDKARFDALTDKMVDINPERLDSQGIERRRDVICDSIRAFLDFVRTA